MASTSNSPNAHPPQSNPNQTIDGTSPPPSNSSAPPPQSSLPPSPPLSPPRPPAPGSPPPSPPASPPTSPPASSPLSPPPSPPASLPASPPLPPPAAPSPTSNSPPPITSSPPPPPPKTSPAPLAALPPSPPAVPPSPPPPPPAAAHSPKHSPPSPPPPQAVPPAPVNHSSPDVTRRAPPLPSFPKEKPIAIQPTRNITANGNSSNSVGLRGESVAVVGSCVGFLALTLMVLAAWFVKRRRKNKDSSKINHLHAKPSPFESSNNSDSRFLKPQYSPQLSANGSTNNFMCSSDGGMGTSRSWFTYEELSEATNGYSTNNLLGEGGFGCVYKGVLIGGREVAVKRLKVGGGQGEREFRAEVEIISRIHHRHLVSLVGYCISGNQRLLVYDYVKNNTLHYHLHDKGKSVMEWASRVKVAAGAAHGLAYLHEDCEPRIIHRDIKSTNILLDNNFEALVADFGLAKLAMELDLHTHVSTRVMGTFGYMAPEYASSGKLTEKSDVFSFGVVLLELITGRKPVDSSQSLDDEGLVEWTRPLLAQALETHVFEALIDPRLENNFVNSEMLRMIEAAAACVRYSASKRPRMSQIARALDSIDDLADLNNGIKPGQSGNFDSREHSAQVRMFERMAFGNEDYYSSDSLNRSQSSWRS